MLISCSMVPGSIEEDVHQSLNTLMNLEGVFPLGPMPSTLLPVAFSASLMQTDDGKAIPIDKESVS